MIFDWDSKKTVFDAWFRVESARDGIVRLVIDGHDRPQYVEEGQVLHLEWQAPRYVFHGVP